jgi:hypothetical protein
LVGVWFTENVLPLTKVLATVFGAVEDVAEARELFPSATLLASVAEAFAPKAILFVAPAFAKLPRATAVPLLVLADGPSARELAPVAEDAIPIARE